MRLLAPLLIYMSVLAAPAYAGSIHSYVSASSDTGGNTAGLGVVVHAGTAAARASIMTVVNRVGSSSVRIVKVATSTSTTSAHAVVRVKISTHIASTSVALSGTSTLTSSTTPPSIIPAIHIMGSQISSTVWRLLNNFFGWFR